jgi:hypothetical protein
LLFSPFSLFSRLGLTLLENNPYNTLIAVHRHLH